MTAWARTRIKFCGMTQVEDVEAAASLGVDAIGLIFAQRSPRRVDLTRARELRAAVSPFSTTVALLMDNEPAVIREMMQTVRPQVLQFHGTEPAAECASYGLPYVKVVPMAIPEGAAIHAARYPDAMAFVLDGHAAGEPGGSGRRFDWSTVPGALGRPIILAGGLTPENVFDAVSLVRPYAVDVSSGIESSPGVKSAEFMRRFVAEVRRADAMQSMEQRR